MARRGPLSEMSCRHQPPAAGGRGGCGRLLLFPALALLAFQLFARQAAALAIVYSCLGSSYDHQHYIWHSILQMRSFNPRFSLHIVFDNAALANSSFTRQRQQQLRFQVHVYNPNNLAGIHKEFKDRFFIQGKMLPGGNRDFNLYTTQRLFAVHWLMESQGLTDVWHLENDNLIYESLDRYQPILEECKVNLAVPFAEDNLAIAGIMYARDAPSLQRLLEFVLKVFKMGRHEAVKFMGTDYLNDMSILAKFFSSSGTEVEGLAKLPSTNTYRTGDNCLWDRHPVLFDAAVVGQWFGGTYDRTTEHFWAPERNFDPREMAWQWRNSPVGYRVPYIGQWRLINVHVHSKHLINFMSTPNE